MTDDVFRSYTREQLWAIFRHAVVAELGVLPRIDRTWDNINVGTLVPERIITGWDIRFAPIPDERVRETILNELQDRVRALDRGR